MTKQHELTAALAAGDLKRAVELLAAQAEAQHQEIERLKSWNPLWGKRIYFLGSSWTWGSACDGKDNFAMRIAPRNGMEYTVEAVNSTTLVLRDGRNDSYGERMDRLPEARPDYVLIQMSSNDARHTEAPVGHAEDFYEEDAAAGKVFDRFTVAGAMEYILSTMMRRWPGTKIAWYTGFCGPVLDSDHARDRLSACRRLLLDEIAPKWGTPVCDLTTHLGLNTFMPGNRCLLSNGDGQHCVSAGYAVWETAIEAFLRSL